MSFDFLIKQREQRLRGILRVSPCENITPHDANTCTACCAVAAERFLTDAVEADLPDYAVDHLIERLESTIKKS